jgi:hypothetical protein
MSMQEITAPRPLVFDLPRLASSRWLWCVVAVLVAGGFQLAGGPAGLLNSLGDTDDATRLHQVRTLLATGGWFDMTLPRIGGAQPLVSHWSRLVDAPLALMLEGFGLFLSPATAELAVRVAWPLLLLCVFFRLLVRAAETQGAPAAAWLMVAIGLTCMTGLYQFRVGRIDHHNAMILGSIGGLLTLLGARRHPAAGAVAGVLIGLGLSVGYEPLAFLLPALALAALWAIYDLGWLDGVRRMARSCLMTLATVSAATIAPWDWLHARCDALSFNMVLLVAGGAAGLHLVHAKGRDWPFAWRFAVLACAGLVGLAGYGALDPRCLAGPFGQVDPAINAIWLDTVLEAVSVFTFFRMSPVPMASFGLLLAAGVICAAERWRRLRTPETAALLALVVLVAPTGLWMVKLAPYAAWLATFAVVLSIADIGPTRQVTAGTWQLTAALFANQLTFAVLATPLVALSTVSAAAVNGSLTLDGSQCMTTPAIRSLAALPKGLFVAPIDFGSYIVALTQHDVVAAPYHRIDKSILENHAILTAEPADAYLRLKKIDATYLALCLPTTKGETFAITPAPTTPPTSLETRLKAGQSFDFLEPMPLATTAADLHVWRVR